MSNPRDETRPSHTIVNRCMPRATDSERAAAKANIDAFAEFIAEVLERIAQQEVDNSIRQSAANELDSDSSPTV